MNYHSTVHPLLPIQPGDFFNMPTFLHSAANSHTFNGRYNLHQSTMDTAVIQMSSYFSHQRQLQSLSDPTQLSQQFSSHDPRQVLGYTYNSWLHATHIAPRYSSTNTFFPFKAFRQDVEHVGWYVDRLLIDTFRNKFSAIDARILDKAYKTSETQQRFARSLNSEIYLVASQLTLSTHESGMRAWGHPSRSIGTVATLAGTGGFTLATLISKAGSAAILLPHRPRFFK